MIQKEYFGKTNLEFQKPFFSDFDRYAMLLELKKH